MVARVAAEAGATVLAFATMPFSHEGERRMRQANEGAIALGQKAHGLVFVHNDLLLQQVSNEAPLSETFAAADAWVGGALRALAAAFEPGALVPVDPVALRSILASPGSPTLFAYGVGSGAGRPCRRRTPRGVARSPMPRERLPRSPRFSCTSRAVRR